ncbi:MAG TPA: hypothetical protein VE995_04045, partial [Gaiellaceae bacterium]|nr:hypothetical protein [Gaiellaceae bacterium]
MATAERALAVATSEHQARHGDGSRWRRAQEELAVARGQLAPLRSALERDEATLSALDDRADAAEGRRQALRQEADELEGALRDRQAECAAVDPEVTEAQRRSEQATAAEADAEGAFRASEARRHRLEARADALTRAAEDAAGSAGAAELAGEPGVVGVLADLVEVDDGMGGALEAALGSVATGVVVEGAAAARAALGRLRQGEVAGTVVAVDLGAAAPSADQHAVPPSLERLRGHVRPRLAVLQGALDRLLAGVVVAGDWLAAVDIALAHPDLVVVTPAGDRLSAAGWVVRAGGARAAAVAAEEARSQAAQAAAEAITAGAALEQARARARQTTGELSALQRRAERLAEQLQSARATRARVEADLARLHDESEEAARHRAAVAERVEHDAADLTRLEARVAELEAAAEAAQTHLDEAAAAETALEERRVALQTAARELEVRAAALTERRAVLGSRLTEVERRLAGHAAEREQAGERRRRLQDEIDVVGRLADRTERIGERLGAVLEQLRAQRARQVDEVRAGGARLEALRRERTETESRLSAVRERFRSLELELAESGVRHEAAVEALRRELACEPAEAMAAPCPELPEGTTAGARAAELERQLAALGPVNPLALEELGSLEERHRFLEEQVDDVRRARRELQQLIREVDDEIMRVFTEAFADVNRHFQVLVGTLFPGGSGRLTLSEPEDLLNTGVEVEARPAGKNVRKLSLLSGGERSLVALAYLFAVFRSRPSPFYLMDEVEAALDDVNLHRFLDLLHEFREEAQLIIVSHQKRTMEAA